MDEASKLRLGAKPDVMEDAPDFVKSIEPSVLSSSVEPSEPEIRGTLPARLPEKSTTASPST